MHATDQTLMSPTVKIDRIFLREVLNRGQTEFYYSSPFAGFAQVALAYTCKRLGLKCFLFCERDPSEKFHENKHEFTRLAESYGANICSANSMGAGHDLRILDLIDKPKINLFSAPENFSFQSQQFFLNQKFPWGQKSSSLRTLKR